MVTQSQGCPADFSVSVCICLSAFRYLRLSSRRRGPVIRILAFPAILVWYPVCRKCCKLIDKWLHKGIVPERQVTWSRSKFSGSPETPIQVPCLFESRAFTISLFASSFETEYSDEAGLVRKLPLKAHREKGKRHQ